MNNLNLRTTLAMSAVTLASCSVGQSKFSDNWASFKYDCCSFVAMKNSQVKFSSDGVWIGNPSGKLFIFVAPYFADHNADASEFVRQMPSVFRAEFPNAQVTGVQTIQEQAPYTGTVARLTFGDGETAEAQCIGSGKCGTVYCVAGPTDQFKACKPFLMETLKSFKFLGPLPKSQGAEGVATTTFNDPREGAFSMDVPAGWKVDGGLFRFAVNDVRPEVTATSPDGQICVKFGDSRLEPRTMPNSLLARAGLRAGSLYNTGYGLKMRVERYQTGEEFAKTYIEPVLRKYQGQVTESHNRPEVSGPLQSQYQQVAAGMRLAYTSGDVSYTATNQGTPFSGYCFASTLGVSSPGGPGVWTVDTLCRYVAKQGNESTAQQVLETMMKSYRFNPQWLQGQEATTMRACEIVAQAGRQINQMMQDSFHNQMTSQDENHRKWDNYIRGVVDVRDPETGETYEVASGSNYYWLNRGQNGYLGTRTDTPPTSDFSQLEQY